MSSLRDAITAFPPFASRNVRILSLTSFLNSGTNFPFVEDANSTVLLDMKRCTAPCPPLPFPDGLGAHRWRSWHHLGLGEQYHKRAIPAFCNSSCPPACILLELYGSSRLRTVAMVLPCIGVRTTYCFRHWARPQRNFLSMHGLIF